MISSITVGQCMTPNPVTIPADLSLADASERMYEHDIRHLPVTDQGHVVGLVSERDLAMITGIPGVDKNRVNIAEAMSVHPYIVSPDASLLSVCEVMIERKIGTAVVMQDGQIKGIFTVIDALAQLVAMLATSK